MLGCLLILRVLNTGLFCAHQCSLCMIIVAKGYILHLAFCCSLS
jgi:hypothetical protein